MPPPAWIREIDHTGDAGIEVSAETPEALFAGAARGMFAVLTDLGAVEPLEARTFTIEADDREALLRRWLTELNFLHVTEGWLFCAFKVTAWSARRLTARVRGERFDPERHTLYTEIKAVTFHGLEVRESPAGWMARVIFDL